MFVCACVLAMVHTRKSEDTLEESVLSFHYRGPGLDLKSSGLAVNAVSPDREMSYSKSSSPDYLKGVYQNSEFNDRELPLLSGLVLGSLASFLMVLNSLCCGMQPWENCRL